MSINFAVNGNEFISGNCNISGALNVLGNITSISGIFYGNGSGLTNLQPIDISGVEGQFASFNILTGELEAQPLVQYDASNNLTVGPSGTSMLTLQSLSGNININAPNGAILLNGSIQQATGETFLNGFLALDGSSQVLIQEFQVRTVDDTPTTLARINVNSINSTFLYNYYIVGNAIEANEGNGICLTGCIANNIQASGTLQISSPTNQLSLPIPLASSIGGSTIAFSVDVINNVTVVTVTGIASILIDWFMRCDQVLSI
jgi:hypothetical protein